MHLLESNYQLFIHQFNGKFSNKLIKKQVLNTASARGLTPHG
jgi:hypothetical protein